MMMPAVEVQAQEANGLKKDEVWVYTSFHEPATDGLRFLYSKDGIKWDSIPGTFLKPEVGKQKVMRDPSIVATPDGTFHLVWTSSWRGDRGFGYSSSKDLLNWTEEKFCEVMSDTSTVNVWAPELFYDESRGEIMIVWASCVPYKFSKGIEDEKNNHRLYYTTTKDFVNFAPERLLYDPGYSVIDAVILKKGGQYVMVLKDNTRKMRNLKISFANDPHGPWGPSSDTFTENMVEGPAVVSLGDGYAIYYDRYEKKDFGAMKTSDFVNFTEITNEVSVPKLHKHGTIFKAPWKMVKRLLKR